MPWANFFRGNSRLGAGRELVMAAGLGDSVLADFVEQRFVADLQNCGRLLAVLVGLLKRASDGLGFGFVLGRARQRLQASGIGCLGGAVGRSSAVAIVAGKEFADGEIFVAKNQIAF